ncbi:MAG TPA: PASTA domain-containing protein [Terriglobales bacterium]|nr:PASTA domain-containing protein [Terriglobales bacterium]
MRNLLRYFLLTLLLLVIALVSALITMRLAIHVREVRVPDFRGKTPSEARLLAEQKGLAVQVESNYYSAAVPEGRVLSQGPAPGTLVRRGWEVQVALSLGPQRVTIPEVVGESDRAAAITIAERGLELSSTDSVQLSGATPDQVIAQNPTANATDVSAPKVSILVAQPPSPESFVMPSFTGQPLGSVTNILKNAGFSVSKVTVAPPPLPPSQPATVAPAASAVANGSPAVPAQITQPATPQPISPASIIVSQDPAPGSKVLTGAAVNFTVK